MAMLNPSQKFQGDAGPAEINVKVENLQPIKKAKRPSTLSFLASYQNGGTLNKTNPRFGSVVI